MSKVWYFYLILDLTWRFYLKTRTVWIIFIYIVSKKKGSKFAISTLSEACWFGKRNIPRQLLAGPLSFCRRWPWYQTLGFSRYWPQCFVPSPPHRLSLRMGPLLNQTNMKLLDIHACTEINGKAIPWKQNWKRLLGKKC